MFKTKTLRGKILFTILVIFLFRAGSIFPVPFINTDILTTSMDGVRDTLFGLFNLMSGGGLGQASMFAMGVSPYINASIIVQLLTVAIPNLEKLKKEGGVGIKKINKITRYVSVVLALVQAIGFYLMLGNWGALTYTGFVPGFIIVLSFVAGSSLVMWMGEQVTASGIGNGISIILVAGMLSGLPRGVRILSGIRPAYMIGLIVLCILAAIMFVVVMNEAEQRIPVQYARASSGEYQTNRHSTLPLKVNLSGVMPVIFASTVLSIPNTIKMFVPSVGTGTVGKVIMPFFDMTNSFYGLMYFVLIIAFNYFYVSIQYDPVEIANNLKQSGGTIPGVRPGLPTVTYIEKSMHRLTLIGAIFLGVIAVVPIVMNTIFSNAHFYLGGTSLLIIVGVAIETVKKMRSTQTVKRYSKLI